MSTLLEEVFQKEQKIYVDYNGTTPLAPEVVAAISQSLEQDWGNPSTLHKLGLHARAEIETARRSLASMVKGSPEHVIFTSGGTEANNMVILGLCRKRSEARKHVITTNVEHDSVALPLKHLKDTEGLEVTEVDASDYRNIASSVVNAIQENTALITVMAANNETGVIMPIKEIGQEVSEVNEGRAAKNLPPVVFHSDGAQILGKESVDVEDLKLDCFTIVGHKFYGPRIGALWSRVPIPPLLFGGGCLSRPGTENTPMIVGLGVAASLVTQHLARYRHAMETARNHLELRLHSLPITVKVNCSEHPRLVNTCNVSFRLPGHYTGREVLARCGLVLAGVGAACHSDHRLPQTGSRVLLNSGVSPSDAQTAIRLSLGRDATVDVVDDIVSDLQQALESLKEGHGTTSE